MGLSAKELKTSLDALAARDRVFAEALERAGYPEPRVREPGYETLMRTIVGQQVSVAAAASMWGKLAAVLDGRAADPQAMLALSDDQLRAAGMSRQKSGYLKSLAGLVASGELDLTRLPEDDEEAIAALTKIKGIGRWSAEIYLLFAEGRPDIWPAGDLAVMREVGVLLGLPDRPDEKQTRELGEAWRPHRGAAAIFAWHHFQAGMQAV